MTRQFLVTFLVGAGVLIVPRAETRAQAAPAIRTLIVASDTTWINGIAEPASGRFVAYASADSNIRIYNRATKHSYVIRTPLVSTDGSNVAVSRSGNLLSFVRHDDAQKGPFVWTIALDSTTGEPKGAPRRVTVVKSRVAVPSSDGKMIAFVADDGSNSYMSGGTRLLVVPSTGGTARMLDSAARGIGQPRWSPDNKWIYYDRRPAMMRIRVDGGKPDSINTASRFIDVSPDGRFLAFYSGPNVWNSGPHTLDIARTDGTIVARIKNRGGVAAWGADRNVLLTVYAEEPAQLRVVSTRDGSTMQDVPMGRENGRELLIYSAIAYSPDGRQLFVEEFSNRKTLAIYQLATGTRRELPVAPNAAGYQWSPDGRYVAYRVQHLVADTVQYRVHVLDVKTGRDTVIGSIRTAMLFQWRSDSRAIDYIDRQRTSPDPASVATASLNRITLDGRRSVVRSLEPGGSKAWFRIVNDSTIVRGVTGIGVALIHSNTGVVKPLYSGEIENNAMLPRVSASSDGKWIAFAVAPAKDKSRQIMVTSRDGSQQRKVGSVGCFLQPLGWLPGDRELVVTGWDCATNANESWISSVDGSPSRPIKITLNSTPVITPDGKGVLFMSPLPAKVTVNEMDISSYLRTIGRR